MSSATPFALLANATAIHWSDVPEWPVPFFVRATAVELDRGARLCAWFGVPEDDVRDAMRLVAVVAYDADNTLAVARSEPFTRSYPALTVTQTQAHMFEREVWEQHAVLPEGHPWLKPVRRTADKLRPLVEAIEADGGRVVPFGRDARVEQQMIDLVEEIEPTIGPIEVAVFNVGANVPSSIPRTTTAA